jgi:hypothetical protein
LSIGSFTETPQGSQTSSELVSSFITFPTLPQVNSKQGVLEGVKKRMIAEGRDKHIASSFHRAIIVDEVVKKDDVESWKPKRVCFDPKDVEHRLAYAVFLVSGKWNGLRFHLEPPFQTVTQLIERRLMEHVLRAELVKARKHAAKDEAKGSVPLV